ncbi:MFS transporter [Paracoccus denitrificans]|uniref:MFS transporter n=1 Tax=Paracoccus denitrificans TaxID=266 RepID=UPI000CEB88EA|nr:MFS transporter [Paracoccus denitrificans]
MTQDHGSSGEFRRNGVLLLAATLGSAAGLSSLPFYSLGSFIAPLEAEFGWSRGEVASSFLYTTMVLAVIAPFLGNVIDRIGTRLVALVSIPLFSAVLYAISRFEGSIGQFHALYALAALAGAGTTPINYTRAVNGAFDKARGFALGISQAGIAVAAITLPLLLASLNQNYSWRTGYFVLALLALVPWPFVLFGFGKLPVQRAEKTAATANRGELFKNWVFWGVGISFAAVAVAVSALVVHMVPLLRDAGMTPIAAASTASVIGFGVLGGRLITGWLIDRFFAPYVAATLFLATAGGCLLLLYGGPGLVPLAAALIGLSLGAEADLIAYLTARYFGMARYAFVYGFIYSMFLVGTASGPALAGRLHDASGNYNSTIWTVICLLVVGSLVILRLPRFEKFASLKPAH